MFSRDWIICYTHRHLFSRTSWYMSVYSGKLPTISSSLKHNTLFNGIRRNSQLWNMPSIIKPTGAKVCPISYIITSHVIAHCLAMWLYWLTPVTVNRPVDAPLFSGEWNYREIKTVCCTDSIWLNVWHLISCYLRTPCAETYHNVTQCIIIWHCCNITYSVNILYQWW